MSIHELYIIKKQGAFHTVQLPNGMVQFRSLSRTFCKEWISDNTPKQQKQTEEQAA